MPVRLARWCSVLVRLALQRPRLSQMIAPHDTSQIRAPMAITAPTRSLTPVGGLRLWLDRLHRLHRLRRLRLELRLIGLSHWSFSFSPWVILLVPFRSIHRVWSSLLIVIVLVISLAGGQFTALVRSR
jgi:hypothetical protein